MAMYIPAYDWRYAFSFRSKGRLAVVSTARMERGCLGLFAANEERQRTRLRKMLGKNLGVCISACHTVRIRAA